MNHNKAVLFLKVGVMWSSAFIGSHLFIFILKIISSEPLKISLEMLTALIIFMTTVATVIVYNTIKKETHVVEYNVEGTGNIFLFVDYYSKLLPAFLITFGMSIFSISVIYQISQLVILGFLIFFISIVFFLLAYPALRTYDVGLNLNLNLSYMIFIRYIYKKETIHHIFIKKFIYFFKESLKNIDVKLDKGIKINNLTAEGNNLSIETIILYLSPYVKYGGKYEKEILKNNLINMRKCITEDNKFKTLKITDCIVDIYKSEQKFVSKYNYQIEPKNPLMKLYEDVKSSLFFFFAVLFLIIYTISNSFFSFNDASELIQSDTMTTLLQPITLLIVAFFGLVSSVLSPILSYIFKNKDN
jgi:hypothetical protein